MHNNNKKWADEDNVLTNMSAEARIWYYTAVFFINMAMTGLIDNIVICIITSLLLTFLLIIHMQLWYWNRK